MSRKRLENVISNAWDYNQREKQRALQADHANLQIDKKEALFQINQMSEHIRSMKNFQTEKEKSKVGTYDELAKIQADE